MTETLYKGAYSSRVTERQLQILEGVNRAMLLVNSTDLDTNEDLAEAQQRKSPEWSFSDNVYGTLNKALADMLEDLLGASAAQAVMNLLCDNGENVQYQLSLLDSFTYDEMTRWVRG